MSWSASQYLKFEDERTRPARELLARVPLTAASAVIDLGCGPANSTELLAARYPQAVLSGLDSDDDMLLAARKRLPSATFFKADLQTWKPDRNYDLIFANAVFQWLPDHLDIVCRILDAMENGAVLALQMPDNLGEPSHLAMEEVAQSDRWRNFFPRSIRRAQLDAPQSYYQRLKRHASGVDLWHTHYYHVMEGAAGIVEWVKGTGLRPFLEAVPEALRPDFLADYTARIAAYYPAMEDGKCLFRFPRLFIVATR